MRLAEDSRPSVFKPRRPDNRRAWRFLGLFLIPYVVITALLWYVSWCVALPWTVSILLTLAFVCLILFRTVSAVDYALEEDALVLRYGKLINYRIRYRSIKDVRRYTLAGKGRLPLQGPWVKMPGLDTTIYSTDDVGDINLLATTSAGPIVLIETVGGNFGINPVDEEGFISALRQQVRWHGDGWDE